MMMIIKIIVILIIMRKNDKKNNEYNKSQRMINKTNFNTNYDDSNTCCSPVDLLTCGSYQRLTFSTNSVHEVSFCEHKLLL